MKNIKRLLQIGPVLVLVIACLVPVRAQDKSEAGGQIMLTADLVVLDVQVLRKKNGLAVGGLTKSDFEIYEDGTRQDILQFGQDKLPLSVVILLDVSGSVTDLLNELRWGAIKAIENLKPEDEVALMVFAGSSRVVIEFTKEKQRIVNGIDQATARGLAPETDIWGAYQDAARFLKASANPDSRRVIIAVTDDVSNHTSANPFDNPRLLNELYEAGIVVNAFLYDTTHRMLLSSGVSDQTVAGRVRATVGLSLFYAQRTGGLAIETSRETFKDRFVGMIDHLRSRYTLAYMSSNTNQDGKFRKVRVKVSRATEKRVGSVGILTRAGYQARRK